MLNDRWVIAAVVLNLAGNSAYIRSTLRGNTRPNRATWTIWALIPGMAFAAQVQEGVGLQALMTFMVGLGPALIVLASFANRGSYWRLDTFSWICTAISVTAVVLWALTGSGRLAIIFSILADGIAALPTFAKSYADPASENPVVFGCAAVSAAITLLTVEEWGMATWAFPAYILMVSVALLLVIVVRRRARAGRSRSR